MSLLVLAGVRAKKLRDGGVLGEVGEDGSNQKRLRIIRLENRP